MSTGLNCEFIEPKPSEWYYVLEDYNAPKNAWDWREHATATGPFLSKEEALEHLDQHHANPGGWNVVRYDQFQQQGRLVDYEGVLSADKLVCPQENGYSSAAVSPLWRNWRY